MNQIEALFSLCEAYCAATSLSEARVSTLALGGGSRLGQIRMGSDIGVRRLEAVVDWFSANWPEGTPWPEGIRRPAAPRGGTPAPDGHQPTSSDGAGGSFETTGLPAAGVQAAGASRPASPVPAAVALREVSA